MRLLALAPAKINLSLYLGPTRADGRHELVTLFESVSLADELSLQTDTAADEVRCPGVAGTNLVTRALEGLRAVGWDAPPVRIEIDKRIPVAAGMGGGSADAAAALRLATELAPGRPEEIAALAASLGADVPSQLAPGVALGTGAGELVEPFAPLAPHGVLIVPQPAPLATAEVYRHADALALPRAADELSDRYEQLVAALGPGERLPSELIVNDLERAATALSVAIAPALDAARAAGADDVLVCGSGPTVIGLFWGERGSELARAAAESLHGRYPAARSATPVTAEFGMPRIA